MVSEKVKAIFIEHLGLSEDQLSMDTELIGDLDTDSLDLVELAMVLEREFNVDIEENDLRELKTVGDVIDYIEMKM